MKILITYDFVNTKPSIGKPLCKKLSFMRNIISALGCQVILDDETFPVFPMNKMFAGLNQEIKGNNFETIDLDRCSIEVEELILSYIKNFDYLITYELSSSTKQFFAKCNVKYIDIWMAPIRFTKDIMFSFNSNDNSIQSQMQKYAVNYDMLKLEAKKLQQHAQLFRKDKVEEFSTNSLLVIGQVKQDKALLCNGEFLSLLNYKQRIFELSREFEKVYFLKHPYVSELDFKQTLDCFEDINNLEYLQGYNVYDLLACEQIKKVVAISSSVLFEAQFFSKEVEYFYQPVINNTYINIYKAFFTTGFWQDILNLDVLIENVEYLNYDNKLRYIFNAFYAYDDFLVEKDDFVLNMSYIKMVEFFDFIKHLDRDKTYILYGYGSIGKLMLPLIKKNIKAVIDKQLNVSTIEGIPVIEETEITNDDNIIVSAFKYNDEIKQDLLQHECKLYNFGN